MLHRVSFLSPGDVVYVRRRGMITLAGPTQGCASFLAPAFAGTDGELRPHLRVRFAISVRKSSYKP
jgi:hypothetical protein